MPTRRSFLTAAAGATLLPAFSLRPAFAAGEVVLATFGGGLGGALRDILLKSYAEKAGLSFADDPSGPLAGRIRAMVQEKNVIWDACDSVSYTAIRLGRDGLLEPIDYDVVDKSRLRPDGALEYGINYGAYSVVLAYDREVYKDSPPSTWADYFDLQKFPGKRGMWQYGYAWEAALLADGVAPDKLYPLDTERAIAKFRSIRDETLFFASGAEGIAALRDGEVSMAILFSMEFAKGAIDSNDRLACSWNQGLKGSTTLVVPKGNPAGPQVAMGLLAHAMAPQIQLELAKTAYIGPGDPAISASLPKEAARFDPNNPEWADQQVPWNDEYYAENEEKLIELFIDRVASN
ncbi:extracellular solute-binding protein [Mesorhizobium sp. AaZ16]|uniref:extracellular solute-binding protein n=1 Tax=Mesorhizobium sp. AaZ16 TaxID=3402289 RepID=UPI00374F3C04